MSSPINYFLYNEAFDFAAQTFSRQYEIVNHFTQSDKCDNLKNIEHRVCRFCGLNATETSFINEAHIISHQLGSKDLISDFECDRCNRIFSKYENQLSNFLGIDKTASFVKGKNGIPSFNSPGKKVTAKLEPFFNLKGVKISAKDNIVVDKNTGITLIDYDKNPYKPLQVYKAMIKMAFCMLPENEVPKYSGFIKNFLLSRKYDKNCKGDPAFKVWISNLPSEFPTTCILYRKTADYKIPTYVMIVFSGRLMYQFWVPYHTDDVRYYKDKEFSIPIMPPFHCNDKYELDESVTTYEYDWSSIDLKREKGYLGLKTDPGHLSNVVSYDPATRIDSNPGEFPSDIVGVILVKGGEKLNLPKT